MTQYKAIPQPQDQRNVSQGDILNNFTYLSSALGATAAGLLPVDHYCSGDNVANPTDGFHKQVSMLSQATPASLTNAVNSQASNAIYYTKDDVTGNGQLRQFNAWGDSPATYLYCAVSFTVVANVPTIVGNSFNCFSIVRNGAGDYRIRFTTNVPTVDYMVFVNSSAGSPGSPVYYAYSYGFKLVNRFDVTIAQVTASTLTAVDPTETSVMVYGFF